MKTCKLENPWTMPEMDRLLSIMKCAKTTPVELLVLLEIMHANKITTSQVLCFIDVLSSMNINIQNVLDMLISMRIARTIRAKQKESASGDKTNKRTKDRKTCCR